MNGGGNNPATENPAPAPEEPKRNCYLTGIESRFLIQLLTGSQVAIQGPALAFSAQLLHKLNALHQVQPVNQEDERAVNEEVILLSSIQPAEQS